MIEFGHAHHDAVSYAHLLGGHRACREEQLRRGAMRILFEKMMLDCPYGIEAELIGELHLLQAVVIDVLLGFAAPRTRDGNLIEQAELHGFTSIGMALSFLYPSL